MGLHPACRVADEAFLRGSSVLTRLHEYQISNDSVGPRIPRRVQESEQNRADDRELRQRSNCLRWTAWVTDVHVSHDVNATGRLQGLAQGVEWNDMRHMRHTSPALRQPKFAQVSARCPRLQKEGTSRARPWCLHSVKTLTTHPQDPHSFSCHTTRTGLESL
jgi:hypothetical protein